MPHTRAAIRYRLICSACGWSPKQDKYVLFCPTCGPNSLLRTHYSEPFAGDPTVSPSAFYHYKKALPFSTHFSSQGPEIGCRQAKELGEALGLNNLWVLFSGYAPRLGSTFGTATFKELEALGVFARVREQTDKILIVSSAGNAARAFLDIGIKYRQPVVVVVPESALPTLHVRAAGSEVPVLLIALKHSHYPAAIQLVQQIKNAFIDRLVSESGCYNVARRDALGVTFLRAAMAMGRIPDHYVQAVGSGTGAIAAWEAKKRLAEAGLLADTPMRLHLAQNKPFTPMVDAWNAGLKQVQPMPEKEIQQRLSKTAASTLSNATPPYAAAGGVYDVLNASGGSMYGVTNREISQARELVQRSTGFVPLPEAAAALAGLRQALRAGRVLPGDCTLLHLTGGGFEDATRERQTQRHPPDALIEPQDHRAAFAVVSGYLDKLMRKRV